MRNFRTALLIVVICAIGLIMTCLLSSCFREGYGCKHNSRTMTGDGMFKRGSGVPRD